MITPFETQSIPGPVASAWHRATAAVLLLLSCLSSSASERAALPKIRVASSGDHFESELGQAFAPFGVTYYRPGTGWAPQVWKQFDAEATRRDFTRLKAQGVNCARVFLTYGSFLTPTGELNPDGLDKFERFLAIAEAAGIYAHPTGPDHWEGLPDWAHTDRYADEKVLGALEHFWKSFAARYRGRHGIFAYDLLNEPEIGWDSPAMRPKWRRWLAGKYASDAQLQAAWHNPAARLEAPPMPEKKDAAGSVFLLDYQHFRESLADDWTRRQVSAIRAADPEALVTIGLIQWAVPSLLPGVAHYAGFRPQKQAPYLDFLTVHFYPLEHGVYEYRGDDEELRNLAYLQSVVRATAQPGKPLIIGEFGWYGGGQPKFDNHQHPFASEEQQARWCRRVVETTAPIVTGWLNWGFYDQPEATDASEFTGLFTSDGKEKAWGRDFQRLAASWRFKPPSGTQRLAWPILDWDACLTCTETANQYRQQCIEAVRRHPLD